MLMLIKGGRVIDPGNLDADMDVLIADGSIIEINKPGGTVASSGSAVTYQSSDGRELSIDLFIDASGKIIVPGFIDMHVHLREPGYEYKETVETGCRAAAWGGFAAVCAMPNTNPVNDNRQVTEYILKQAAAQNTVRVYPVAGLSKGLEGKNLCEYDELKKSGVIALSDNKSVISSQFMRRAMEYAGGFGLLVISHCQDPDLSAGGVMNEGSVATLMGLAGIPNAAESIMVMRDLALCEMTKTPIHISNVSTAESVRIIRDAKCRGLPVTAATAPQYFTLTEAAVKDYNTNAKMTPPLRSHQDREAVCQGLADGTIDVIASDHSPHTSIEKELEFDRASDGIVGLETSVSLGLRLVEQGIISIKSLVEKMSTRPAEILGVEKGIKSGGPADISIIDLEKSFTVISGHFQSLGRNTPFENWQLKGKPVLTMVGGNVVYDDLS